MWGGTRTYPITANASLTTALYNFALNGPADPSAALYVSFVYYNGTFLCSTSMEYALPIPNPGIFYEFSAVESIASTMRITNLTNLTAELESLNPHGFRETYVTATFKPNTALMQEILSIYMDSVSGIKDATNVLPAITMQPITQNTISYFRKNGGNALGISESDGPLICESTVPTFLASFACFK